MIVRKIALITIACLVAVSSFGATAPANWKQLGKAGEWADTVAIVGMDGYLWSIEGNGTLYRTDKSGHYEQIGDAGTFKHVSLLAGMSGWLFTVEDGTLYRTNTSTGNWKQLGKPGEWE